MCLENVPEPRSSAENAEAQPETCSASKRRLEHVPCPREVNTSVHPGGLTFQKVALRLLLLLEFLRAPLWDVWDAGGNSHRHTHTQTHTHRHTHTDTHTQTHTHTHTHAQQVFPILARAGVKYTIKKISSR